MSSNAFLRDDLIFYGYPSRIRAQQSADVFRTSLSQVMDNQAAVFPSRGDDASRLLGEEREHGSTVPQRRAH